MIMTRTQVDILMDILRGNGSLQGIRSVVEPHDYRIACNGLCELHAISEIYRDIHIDEPYKRVVQFTEVGKMLVNERFYLWPIDFRNRHFNEVGKSFNAERWKPDFFKALD